MNSTLRIMRKQVVFLISLALNLGLPALRADEPVYEAIETIKSKFDPGGDMVNSGDGYFYGVARWSDQHRGGAIFRVGPRQSVEMIHAFTYQPSWPEPNAGGSTPSTNLSIGPDGAFYGATQGGGAHGWGVIYRITPEGAFSVLYDLNYTDALGVTQLIKGPDGFLYGCGNYGGTYNYGRLFRVSLGGSFEVLYDFGSPALPPGSGLSSPLFLCFGADGKLYGTTLGSVLYRYDGPGQITIVTNLLDLGQFYGRCFPTPDGFYITTDRQLVHVTLAGEKTELANFKTDGMGDSVSPVTGIVTPDGFYGITSYGGANESGFVYRYVQGQGVDYLHEFGPEFRWNGRSLALGNDGLIYGIAVLPEEIPALRTSAAGKMTAAVETRAKRAPAAKGGRSFRLRDVAASVPNFVPVTGNETVMLPAKAEGAVREVTVAVLSNDRDPDLDPLSLAGVGAAGDGTVEIVQGKGGQSLRFSTAEADPPSRKIVYQVADDMGGQSTANLHLLSPAKGVYQGGGDSTGQLTVSIGSGNQCKVTYLLGGQRFSGKGVLDSGDGATIQLKAKKLAPVMLRLDLARGVTRQLSATVTTEGGVFTILCE